MGDELVFEKRIFVNSEPMQQSVQIFIAGKDINGERVYVPKLEWVNLSNEDMIASNFQPTTYLRMENAQALMDDLWKIGFRPSEGTGSAGSLKATENHLKDMQQLVWKLLPWSLGEKDKNS